MADNRRVNLTARIKIELLHEIRLSMARVNGPDTCPPYGVPAALSLVSLQPLDGLVPSINRDRPRPTRCCSCGLHGRMAIIIFVAEQVIHRQRQTNMWMSPFLRGQYEPLALSFRAANKLEI